MSHQPPKAPFDWESRQPWLDLAFPESEYRDRLRRIQAAMRQEGLDVLLVHGHRAQNGHVLYIANFNSFLGNSFVVIPVEGEPVLVTESVFHGEPMHSMIWTSWIREVRYGSPFDPTPETFVKHTADVLTELRLDRSVIGLVGERWVPSVVMEGVRVRVPHAKWHSAQALWRRVTAVKSHLEIEALRTCVRIAGAGFAAGFEKLKPGASEFEVSAAIHHGMVAAGAHEVWTPIAVTGGPKAGFKHNAPTARRFCKGDMVFIDISPYHKGYVADVARTLVVGDPTPEQRRILDTALLMSEEVIKAAKPGVDGNSLRAIATAIAKDAGLYEYFYPDGLAHGIGSTKFEAPLIQGTQNPVLEEGMVFALEPMIVVSGVGTGVVEDDILVTATGAEILECYPRKLW